MGVLEIWDGTAHRKVGCGTHPNGRLNLRDTTGWVGERCIHDPPTSTVVDSFNRADSTLGLGTTSDGKATWTNASTDRRHGISSNRAYLAVPAAAGAQSWIDTRATTQDVQVTFPVLPDSGTTGLILRRTAAATFILVGVQAGGTMVVLRSSGGFTNITPGGLPTFTAGDVLRVTVAAGASLFTIYRNGVSVGTVSDALNPNGTQVGLYSDSGGGAANTVRLDDFQTSAQPGRPLKMWDGTAWVTVACMVPT